MKRRRFGYMLASYCVIAVFVMSIILLVDGIPAAPARSSLPSGLGRTTASIGNVLRDSDFNGGNGIATDWLQEHSTAGTPEYLRPADFQEISYAGSPSDTGLKRKIEVFQAIWHGVNPGQRWRFSIQVRGEVVKSYTVVGMEWFSVFKHTADGVVGYGYHYIDEDDVYPPVGSSWQQVTVTSPALPTQAKCVAVYVQLPEINSGTKIDIQIRSASLDIISEGSG